MGLTLGALIGSVGVLAVFVFYLVALGDLLQLLITVLAVLIILQCIVILGSMPIAASRRRFSIPDWARRAAMVWCFISAVVVLLISSGAIYARGITGLSDPHAGWRFNGDIYTPPIPLEDLGIFLITLTVQMMSFLAIRDQVAGDSRESGYPETR